MASKSIGVLSLALLAALEAFRHSSRDRNGSLATRMKCLCERNEDESGVRAFVVCILILCYLEQESGLMLWRQNMVFRMRWRFRAGCHGGCRKHYCTVHRGLK